MKTLLRLLILVLAAVAFNSGRRVSGRGWKRPVRSSVLGRRLLMGLGSVALVTGLSLIALGAYRLATDEAGEVHGANVRLVRFTDTTGMIYDWPAQDEPTPTPSPTTAAPAAAPAEPPLRDAPYRIVMPQIGVDAQVVTYGLDANLVPQVPYNGWEVAWYDFSARPGTGGNAVFAGHVTWNGHAVFYDLDKLAPGDDIILRGTDGTTVSYKVSEVFLVDASDPNAVSVMGPTTTDMITVITCGGSYFYVGGIAQYDYTHRLVVRGNLVGVQPGGEVAMEGSAAGG